MELEFSNEKTINFESVDGISCSSGLDGKVDYHKVVLKKGKCDLEVTDFLFETVNSSGELGQATLRVKLSNEDPRTNTVFTLEGCKVAGINYDVRENVISRLELGIESFGFKYVIS